MGAGRQSRQNQPTNGVSVSQSHEPSYYEIALTGRQVLIALVILLVCLVAAFLSGVWVGRGGRQPLSVEARLGTAGAAGSGEAQEVKPLEEFKFFSEDKKEKPAEPVSPAPTEKAAKPEPAKPEPAKTADTKPAAAAPSTTPTPTPKSPRVREEPQQKAAAPSPPASRPEAAGGTAEAAAGGEGVVIQVLSSREQAQAQKVLERLLGAGYDAFLSPVEVDGQIMYRVRIGPFRERSEAERVADRVRHDFHLDTWITQ